MFDRRVETLPGNKAVLAENGPLRLVIQAYQDDYPDIELAKKGAQYSFGCLERVAAEQELLRRPHPQINVSVGDEIAEIARTMIASVRLIGDKDLTPMAAVAGTIADFVANYIFKQGATRVIVDNGGDIAIRLAPAEIVRVGFRPEITSQKITHLISIDSRSESWGVNTSGLGGRSLTRGIASGVTAFATTSSVADAAATAIANSCIADDDNIRMAPASSIDPNSDLGDLLVTVSATGVSQETKKRALNCGLKKAEFLVEKGIIRGAVLAVGENFAMTSGFDEQVGEISR